MGITPLGLSGGSRYASDFQNILTRAVRIAEIPLKLLQNRDGDLLQQKTLYAGLRTSVAELAASLSSLGGVAERKAIAASSSDSSVVSISTSAASSLAIHTINSVTSTASIASERSMLSYADSASTPVSSNGQMELKVGSQTHSFTLTTNTLIGLRDKINSLGAGVSASILTTGNGNYLSVTANSAGQTTLQLVDDPSGAATQHLTSTNQGTDAVFSLNGIPITQKSNFVTSVIPGVTFQLLKSSNTPVTISLNSDRTKLSTALQDFVAKYNDLKSQVNAQAGVSAGLLTGGTIVTGLGRILREVASHRLSSGQVRGLADLGVVFDNTGKASFDSGMFQTMSDSAISDGFSFIGTAASGLGGFSKSLAQYSDPISGLIRHEQDGIDRRDASLQAQITVLTDRINEMQNRLYERLTLADSLLSQLESQQKTIDASLQGLGLVLYGRNDR